MRVYVLPLVLTALVPACTQASPDDRAGFVELSAQLEQTNARLSEVNERLERIETQLAARERADHSQLERMRERREQRREAGAPDAAAAAAGIDVDALEAGIKCTDEGCTVARALLDDILANPAELARSFRVVPATEDGVQRGFKLFGMRPRTIGPLLGFENGDRILSINERGLDSVESAMDSYLVLRDARELTVAFERRGQARALKISFE